MYEHENIDIFRTGKNYLRVIQLFISDNSFHPVRIPEIYLNMNQIIMLILEQPGFEKDFMRKSVGFSFGTVADRKQLRLTKQDTI